MNRQFRFNKKLINALLPHPKEVKSKESEYPTRKWRACALSGTAQAASISSFAIPSTAQNAA